MFCKNCVPRLETSNFIEKEFLMQVFSCEFYEISKNTVFYKALPVAASDRFFFARYSDLSLTCE